MSPQSHTLPEHQVQGATGASLSELCGTGHLEPLVSQFAGQSHKTASLLGVAVITPCMLTLGPLLSLGLCLRACGRTRLPSRGLGVLPWIRVVVASVLVLVLVDLFWVAISASSSSTLALVLAFPTAFRLALPESLLLPLPPPLPEPLPGSSPFSFADRRCLS